MSRLLKRDGKERAFKLGYTQGLRGHSKEICPFHDADKRGQWMGGWRRGRSDYMAGYRSPPTEL